MDIKSNRAAPLAKWLLGIGLALAAGQASAAEVWLCAKAGTVDMPGEPGVPIWGYVLDSAGFGGNCTGTVTLPGPALSVPAGDASLTVHLRNDLTLEPTSIVIPGQAMPDPIAGLSPVWTDGSTGVRTSTTQRVRSFTHEAAANGGTADYTWANIKPGSYLYHSGTHPQVQVQMGLYGALVKNAVEAVVGTSPAEAYSAVPYDTAVTLLFSEIDPAQHSAIAAGTFGTPGAPGSACLDTDGTPMPLTSTLCYKPKYFLLNGKPFQAGDPVLATVAPGQNTLLRLLNAGYRAYVPLIQGTHMRMVAEDGNRYQYRVGATTSPRDQYQYSTWLAALKTTDAMIAPAAPGKYPIYDRRLYTVTGTTQDGGLFGILQVAAATGADLAITKTDGVNSVAQSGSVTYTIVVSNAGPDPVTGATVTDNFPATLTVNTWTCSASAGSSCAPAGTGNNRSGTVDLLNGGSATFTASATVAANATGNLINTATVAAAADTNLANNSATDTDTIQPPANADLAVTITNGVTTVVAGNAVQYTIVVSNAGPAAATGATVSNAMPAQVTAYNWACAATPGSNCPITGGSGSIDVPVNLLAGGSVTFTVNATIGAGATGTLANTATVTAPAGTTDLVAGNNTASDNDPLTGPQANLGITKTDGLTNVFAGGSLSYTIVVSNAGPNSVTGATVNDAMPAALTAVTWTCSAAPGSLCPAPSGSGSLVNAPVTLPSGGSVTFVVNAALSAATPAGTLTNTATVTAPAGVTDPVPGNNSATDVDTVAAASANLAVTKTNNTTVLNLINAPAGLPLAYTIVVSNAGPSLVTGATVVDNLPATLTGVTWNCVATAGSSCPVPLGAGNINTTVNLAVGGSATFTVNATLIATATGTLTNTATVSHASDTTPANNSATDTDTIVPALPVVPLLDNFNRANANNLGANWSQANTGAAVDIRVLGNQASVNGVNDGGQAIWNTPVFGATQAAAFTFSTTIAAQRNNSGLILKATGGTTTAPTSFVRVLYQTGPGRVVIQTTANGGTTFTTIGTLNNANSTFANGNRLTARVLSTGVVQVWKTTGAGTVYVGDVTLPANALWTTGGGRIGMKFVGATGGQVNDFGGN